MGAAKRRAVCGSPKRGREVGHGRKHLVVVDVQTLLHHEARRWLSGEDSPTGCSGKKAAQEGQRSSQCSRREPRECVVSELREENVSLQLC